MDTLKKSIIRSLACAASTDVLKGNNLILTTSAGIISGTLYDEDENNAGTLLIAKLLDNINNDYSSENIQGNDGYLYLSDVTILTGPNARVTLSNLVVFYDQIIGVTIGNL